MCGFSCHDSPGKARALSPFYRQGNRHSEAKGLVQDHIEVAKQGFEPKPVWDMDHLGKCRSMVATATSCTGLGGLRILWRSAVYLLYSLPTSKSLSQLPGKMSVLEEEQTSRSTKLWRRQRTQQHWGGGNVCQLLPRTGW